MNMVMRAFLRSLLRRRALTLIQLAGVACGVAAVVGMVLASNAAIDSFGKAVDFLQGRSTHSLSRPVGPLPESVLADLMIDPAVTAFAPDPFFFRQPNLRLRACPPLGLALSLS